MYPYENPYGLQNQINAQYQQIQNIQQSQARTIIDRVQGEASADVYPVQAGQEVILFDMDNPYVYRKARGLDNKLEQQRFRLVPDEKKEEPKQEVIDMSQYVKTDEITQIVSDAIERKMSEYTLKPKNKKQTEEE
jgi:hypothetical protein